MNKHHKHKPLSPIQIASKTILVCAMTATIYVVLWQSYNIALNSGKKENISQQISLDLEELEASNYPLTTVQIEKAEVQSNVLNPNSISNQPGLETQTDLQGNEQTSAGTQTMSAIEKEILRLTNEMRTNPYGAESRENPIIVCNDKEIDVQGLSPLELDLELSNNMSRAWSVHMSEINDLQHRSGDQQRQIMDENQISWRKLGENIAYLSNYRSSNSEMEIARVFFEGWRDSDSHYCNMMSSEMTHIGLGHYYDATSSTDWATQNFYQADK